MIQKSSKIKVCDNSGIKKVKCIKIFGTSNPRYAFLGNLVLIAISNKDLIRGFSNTNIKYGLITNTKNFYKRVSGEFIRFDFNSCLVINKNKSFPSTRVYNPIVSEVKRYDITGLMLYAEAIL